MALMSQVVRRESNSGFLFTVTLNISIHMEELPYLHSPTLPSLSKLYLKRSKTLSVSGVSTRLMQWQDMPAKAKLGSRDLLAEVNLSN